MTITLTVFCDFGATPLGLPSRLVTDLHGARVIHHTLRRAARVLGVDRRVVICRATDAELAARCVEEAGLTGHFEIVATDPGVRPRALLTRTARKWAIDSWRSNPLGLTWYDEFIDPTIIAAVLGREPADGWLCFDGHQVALDVDLASSMVEHARTRSEEAPYVFTQAPPGLTGLLLTRTAVDDLLHLTCPFGLLLSYRPEMPVADPITAGVCHAVPSAVATTRARLLADTRRSCELLGQAFAALGSDVAAEPLCTWFRAPGRDRAGPLPVETEIELTTDDQLGQTTLRPRGERVPRRSLIDLSTIQRVAAELGAYDDRLVVLGGHGDPLMHPHFPEACRLLRAGGVFGVAVVTPLTELTETALDALLGGNVDVVEVQIDAHSRETYRKVHQADLFDRVTANIERIDAARRDRQSPTPVAVCSLTRGEATLHELEAFYDHWMTVGLAASIHGYSTYGGLLGEDRSLATQPPVRRPCARLGARLMLHADGRTPFCSQDARGASELGRWDSGSLRATWNGEALTTLRKRQLQLDLGCLEPCASCDAWHRP